jgi:tetratricopeptide (TPR) repeat protein
MKLCLLKALSIGFAALLLHSSVLAQRTATHPVTLEVHGQVRYGDTRTPAANIIVRLETFSGGVTGQILTDREGKFLFSGLASTQYILTIHAPGYRDFQQSIDLLTATSDFVYAYLSRERGREPSMRVGYIDANVPDNARKEFEKGQAALSEQKNKEIAIRHFESAVRLYARFFEAELSLGVAYMDISEWLKAEAALRRALDINRKLPSPLFALGELLLRLDRLNEAEQTLREGLKLENRSWQAHFALARVYVKKRDLPGAGRQLALTLQLNPEAADPHLLAGDVLMRSGKLDDALTEFEEYLRLSPKGTHAAEAREAVRKIKNRQSSLSK